MIVITFPDSEMQEKQSPFSSVDSVARYSAAANTSFPRRRFPQWRIRTSRLPLWGKRPMKSKSRRYEVLLPLQFNDGRDVPELFLADAVNEIVKQFGAVTFYRHAEGRWRQDDTTYRDNLALLVVDVADTAKDHS